MNPKTRGTLLLISSTIIYGLYGVFSKKTVAFGSFSQGWVRSILAVIIILGWLALGKFKWTAIKKKDIKWFLVWLIPSSVLPILSFLAFNHLPIGMVTFLNYATMISGGIISGRLFFSEKINSDKLASLVLILVGLILIYYSDISLATNIYVFFALLSGLILGFWNTLTKKISGNYSSMQMILLDKSSTFVAGFIGFLFTRESLPSMVDSTPWLWILIFAYSSIFVVLLLMWGFKYLGAQVGTLILPTGLVFSSIFGYLFFGEMLRINAYIGGILIFLAAVLPVIKWPKLFQS